MVPKVKPLTVNRPQRQKTSEHTGVDELLYNVSIGLAKWGAFIIGATFLIYVVYFWLPFGEWGPIDSAPSHNMVFEIKQPKLDAYLGVPLAASGLLIVAAGVFHFAVLGIELLFGRPRIVEWKSIGIWAGLAVSAIGIGAILSYNAATSNSLTIDHQSETLIIDKSFLFKGSVHDVIPFSDVIGVRYEYLEDDAAEGEMGSGWVYLSVRGRAEEEIASGHPWSLYNDDMAEAISNSTGVPIIKEERCDKPSFGSWPITI